MNNNYFIRVIRLIAFLYLAVFLQVCYAAHSQTITYKAQNESLQQIFQAIKKQTNYEVLSTKKLVEDSRPVSINATRMPLKDFLDKILQDQSITYRIVENTILLNPKIVSSTATKGSTSVVDSQQPIRGLIIDKNKTPLAGASILSDNQQLAVADETGRFSLENFPKNMKVTVQIIGYQSLEYTLRAGTFDYTITLEEETNDIEEMIVTGYQVINRNSYTGTAVTKSGEELRQVNPQNVLQAMQVFDPSFRMLDNNLAGSDPNMLPNITVRGSSALPSGNNEILRRDNITSTTNMPAFIMDGYEVNVQKVLDLDMTRIESVTLLKDAAATAIYGSRAANGVMVITTKAPKDGKLRLSYTHESHVNTPDLRDYQLLNASEKLEYERLAGLYNSTLQSIPQNTLDELYYQKYANVIGGVDTYWLSQPLRTAIGQKHSLYVDGGSSVFRYGLDLRYQNRPGVMKGSARNQYSGGLNFNYNPNRKIRFQNELTITKVAAHESPYGNFSSYVRMNPYYRMTDDKGNIIQQVDTWNRVASSGASNAEFILNPLYNATLSGFDNTKYTEIMNNFAGEFELAEGLRLRGQLSLLNILTEDALFKSPLANDFFHYSPSRTNERGSYQSTNSNFMAWDANIRVNWIKTFNYHNINLVAGTNIRTENYDRKSFTAIGFANDRFNNIGFARGYAENASPSSDIIASRLFGSFLSTNYSFDNRYLFDATVRLDGSSKFGANNRIAPFWSTGIGWNIHKESWFDYAPITELRLRATTGLIGAVQFSPNMARTTYSYDQGNWYSSGVGAIVNRYGNPNLAWQKTQSTDVGFDLSMFEGRLFLSPRLYHKLTRDILADINVAPSVGFQSYKENLGDLENRGFEINFNVVAVRNQDWTVNLTTNLAHNTNKIIKISNALKSYNERANDAQGSSELMGVPLLRYNEGQSLDAIYAVRSLGIDPESGREVYIKRDGSLTYNWSAEDIDVVGITTPKIEGSFGTNVRYKRFTATAYFMMRMGGKNYNQTLVDRIENADPRYNVDRRVLEERWKNPGDVTFYKSIQDIGFTRVSSRFVMPDNILSLQSLSFLYEASPSFTKQLSLTNLRLGLTGNDIFRWSSIRQERGIEYPFARSISFTLQASL